MKTTKQRSQNNIHFMKKWSPKTIFLVDACGAIFTAFTLGVLFIQFETFIGIGNKVLYLLSMYALILFFLSMSTYIIQPKKWVIFLKIIAALNFIYCIITLITVVELQAQITSLGKAYFIIEALLIATIAALEWSYLTLNKTRGFNSKTNQEIESNE
jgi:hypothetical protein